VTEKRFWAIINRLEFDKDGDHDAVIAPAVCALAKRPVEDIIAFHELLAEKLFALDTREYAKHIGEYAYHGPADLFSADGFLYARCAVVANGQFFYEWVLDKPERMPKNSEFEMLLAVARRAFEQKTGTEWNHMPRVSYETFSNRAGWA
jgi:hypothetical protein